MTFFNGFQPESIIKIIAWNMGFQPLIAVSPILLLKFSGLASFAENGSQILLVTLLATITPSASTITQMAQVYGKDARYAGAINVITTLFCMITMPIMVYLYQL